MRPPGGSWRALRGHVLACFGSSECRHRLQKITPYFCEPLAAPRAGGIRSTPLATSHVALVARGTRKHCTVYDKANHTNAECFETGGGRSGWSKQERVEFFEEKKRDNEGRWEPARQ
jgi:hypothetical protein